MALIPLTPYDLSIAALILLIPALSSILLSLRLEKSLGVAALRTVIQLALIGFVLEWIFTFDRWYFVLPYLLFMIAVASFAAVSRSTKRVSGSRILAFGALILSTSLTAFIMTEVIIGIEPWYSPRYLIPLVGMLLGNGLNGISLGMDRMLNGLVNDKLAIEARLSLGANCWQASRPWIREALRSGMIPIINSMTVVGLVSLPGLMTGQILAGAAPKDAVSYQILIMFMIAASTAIGVIILCLLTLRTIIHPEHRIRWHRIY